MSTAPTREKQALARQLLEIAETWRGRGVHLVAAADFADSTAAARHDDRRTTDEIAVLYLNGVIYGLGSGAVVALHTEPGSFAGAILPALLLGGAGAGAVALVDSGRGLRYGVPQSIVSGMYIGAAEGIVWSVWNQAHVNYDREWRARTVGDVIWAGATVGAVGGGVLANTSGSTPGRASYVGSFALWSSIVAGLVAGAAGRNDDKMDDRALLAAAIGLNAGAVAGVFTAGTVSPSIARVRFLDLGALAGGLVAGGLYLSAADIKAEPQPAFVLTSLGIVAGLGTAWWLTAGLPKDRPENEKRDDALQSVRFSLAPVRGGAQLSAFGGF